MKIASSESPQGLRMACISMVTTGKRPMGLNWARCVSQCVCDCAEWLCGIHPFREEQCQSAESICGNEQALP